MKTIGIAAIAAASLAAAGCASYPDYGYGYGPQEGPYYGSPPPGSYYNNGYYYDSQGRRIATGAAIGAATGAVAGAILPGVSPVGGAVAGAILGGVHGHTQQVRRGHFGSRRTPAQHWLPCWVLCNDVIRQRVRLRAQVDFARRDDAPLAFGVVGVHRHQERGAR